MNIFDDLVQLLGNVPFGFDWLVYIVCCCLVVFAFSNGLRVIAYVLGVRK